MNKRFRVSTTLFFASCAWASVLASCGGSTAEQGAASLPTDTTVTTEVSPNSSQVQEKTTLLAVGLDPDALNREISPCDDFYQFACGGWLEKTEIPADKSRYGRFTQIYERNEVVLHSILDEARAKTLKSPVSEKIGAYYGACMDEAAVESAGTKAITPLMAIIKSVKNTKTLDKAISQLHKNGVPALFRLSSSPDYVDATLMIAEMTQGGLGLPDRDYYLKDDERNKTIRAEYKKHIAAMFVLNGMKSKIAGRAAADVINIETQLAKASMTREARRNPENIYHRIELEGVSKLVPSFDFAGYFAGLGFPNIKNITVDSPEFFSSLEPLRKKASAKMWRNYLSWHVLDSHASLLPKAYVEQNFKMSQVLSGAKVLPPRWKRCVSSTDHALGEMLAQPYLEKMFTPAAKAGVDGMVQGISKAFGVVVNDLSWMSDATKVKAHEKLSSMSPLFGYPATFRTYDFEVTPKAYAANAMASRRHEKARDLAKIGKTYDRSEWFMSPQTTNAYYNPQANQMVFPAGILQPPFFSEKAHVPVNLGAMGMIVGHELTHGFDDSGAKFDAQGNMKNWWAPADLKQFASRGECVVDQYASYEPLPGLHLNGNLTLGENIADIGGVKLAFMAYREMVANNEVSLVADGYNEDQQFFLAVGQAWCSKSREEVSRALVVTDPHSPAPFRVNGSLSNSPEFAEAWGCEKGSPMTPEVACSVW
ncbi:MAG: M13 family metallopeptidase [Kofleriaceae bacterium]|nr:M13 family metallopeptidase [Kofleriaceae bacterium]